MSKWKTLPNNAGNSSQKNIADHRYQVLSSTFSNNLDDKAALFENTAVQMAATDSTSLSFNLIDLSTSEDRHFGILLHDGGPKRYLLVGYNAKQWFWEYKTPQTERKTVLDLAPPKLEEAFKLSVNLKQDGQLNLLLDDQNLVDNANIPAEVMQDLVQSRQVYLKLGTSGLNRTTVGVLEKVEERDWSKEPVQSGPEVDDTAVVYDELDSGQMVAVIDTAFPRVREYHYAGHTLFGQVKPLTAMAINGHAVVPKVTYKKLDAATAQYVLEVVEAEYNLDLVLMVQLKVEGKILHFDVTDIQNKHAVKAGELLEDVSQLVEQISFPENYLVSVVSDQAGANYAGSAMSNDTHHSGDRFMDVVNPMADLDEGIMYAFVGHEQLAAGVWSNSQYSHGGKTEDYTRLTAQKQTLGQSNYIGIASSPWIYETAYRYQNELADKASFIVNPDHTLELPSARVVLTTDLNGDGKVDWQDAAIAYRDIMHHPFGADQTPDLVGYRIAMNFGSQAQNPFLTTLDEIKKVYLQTDGLEQAVMLKGYGNEGHDSGHLNYKDIGQRMGGVDDFRYLLKEGKKLGANIGLHVNASETYPESPYFEPDRLRKDSKGQYHYGWNWLDQAINIDSAYDLAHGRYDRFKDLKDVVGDDLNYLYVDVWGNHQSGDERAWATHQLSKEINSLGWRVAYEWGHAGEYDATFHHWAVDQPYGGYAFKGINSTIARFIRNNQKDAWVADYPRYGGAAVTPLLGGYVLNDFEGWQGRSNYQSYLDTLFAVNLPTKYLQHFTVAEVQFGEAVAMTDNGESYEWTPEMYMRLENAAGDVVEIRRMSNDVDSADYRIREIRLNGEVVLLGDTYLIPWPDTNKYYYYSGVAREVEADERLAGNGVREDPTDDAAVTVASSKAEESRVMPWTLPQALAGKKLFIYELTPQGKANELVVESGEMLDVDLARNTPYVIYLEAQEQERVEWSAGSHLVDTGFNSGSLDHWVVSGDTEAVEIVLSQGANPMLKIDSPGEATRLTQAVKDLKPNTEYVAYVAVDNRSDAVARLSVAGVSHGLTRSLAQNYVKADPHNTLNMNATVDNSSYFQNLMVYFTTGENPADVELTLSREPGIGATYWDNLRIVENQAQLFDGGHETVEYPEIFIQDFENVPQGIFPFVIADGEGVEDNRIHLAEKNAPYSQRGWHDKKISDVIGGDWSLKVNGLVGLGKLLYRTIPQNYCFKAGAKYKVTFDYEAGLDDHYAFVIGDGEEWSDHFQVHFLGNTWEADDAPATVSFEFTAKEDESTWIGIYSTDKKLSDAANADRDYNFKSYKDLILDNLVIERLT